LICAPLLIVIWALEAPKPNAASKPFAVCEKLVTGLVESSSPPTSNTALPPTRIPLGL
jgi:hypothetical protein